MLKQIYVNNYRCMRNFSMKFETHEATMIIGLNGVGKTTLMSIFHKLQLMACGDGRIDKVFSAEDFSFADRSMPIRIEVLFDDAGHQYEFKLALEMPQNFTKLRILEEDLLCDGRVIYGRNLGQVVLNHQSSNSSKFIVDWHMFALPIIQDDQGEASPINDFRSVLRRMLIISPIPQAMDSSIKDEGDFLRKDCSNFASWLEELQRKDFRIGSRIVAELKETIYPDLLSYSTAFDSQKESRLLSLIFGSEDGGATKLDFSRLSDGEKCMFVCAALIAQVEILGCPLCFWDEPDNYMAISEVRAFVSGLRKAFRKHQSQLMLTSHNPQAIESISEENVHVFLRDSHTETLRDKQLTEMLKTQESRNHLDMLLLTGRLYDEEA